jgi:hypothetical protein
MPMLGPTPYSGTRHWLNPGVNNRWITKGSGA